MNIPRHTVNLFWICIIAVIAWVTMAPPEATAAGQCLYLESGDEKLACTDNLCVMCTAGECKTFNPRECGRAW